MKNFHIFLKSTTYYKLINKARAFFKLLHIRLKNKNSIEFSEIETDATQKK